VRIYLDHAATTPLDPGVLAAMRPYLESEHGNPSSSHATGRAARAAVEQAREQVATALGVAPLDVMFTSGGTESDNAAIKGTAWAARAAGRGNRLVTTAIEHHAVLETVQWLADEQGFELTVVPVRADGVVDADRLLDAVRDDTVLVSVMAANNEIGTIQPLEVIGPALARRQVPLHRVAVGSQDQRAQGGGGLGAGARPAGPVAAARRRPGARHPFGDVQHGRHRGLRRGG